VRPIFAAIVIVVLGIGGAIGGSYWLAARALNKSEHALCPIVKLATKHAVPYPADAAKNSSRLQTWEWYEDFLTVRHQYRCG
jgi:hypothetical protein